MPVSGLKPHTHAERQAVVDQLIPLFERKFGADLLAIAASASFARNQDRAYSDLELEVFVRNPLPPEEDGYLQRIVDGMLVEVIYRTPEAFLAERTRLAEHWTMSASDRLVGVYNAPFVEGLMAQIEAVQHPESEFLVVATRKRFELQEGFSKVFNAVEAGNVEGVSLLVMDAALHLLHVLALVNRHSFTTFARYIPEARGFAVKPEGFDELLDLLVRGEYADLARLGQVMWAVFAGVERIFEERGVRLYADPLDPNLPNRAYLTPAAQRNPRLEKDDSGVNS